MCPLRLPRNLSTAHRPPRFPNMCNLSLLPGPTKTFPHWQPRRPRTGVSRTGVREENRRKRTLRHMSDARRSAPGHNAVRISFTASVAQGKKGKNFKPNAREPPARPLPTRVFLCSKIGVPTMRSDLSRRVRSIRPCKKTEGCSHRQESFQNPLSIASTKKRGTCALQDHTAMCTCAVQARRSVLKKPNVLTSTF